MDGFLPCFCELAYRFDPVSEDLDVVNNCHISQFYFRFFHLGVLKTPICLSALEGDWIRDATIVVCAVGCLQVIVKKS